MKKQTIYVLLLTIAFISVITGCLEQSEPEKNEIQITSFNIKTQAYSYDTGWKNFSNDTNPDSLPEIVTDSDVVLRNEFYKARYLINGTAKNIGENKINIAIVTLYFYDNNNTLLKTKQLNTILGLSPGETWDFEYEYTFDDIFLTVYNIIVKPGPKEIDFKPDEN